MKTMKTIYILAAFMGLQVNTIFATANCSEFPVLSNDLSVNKSCTLIPVTPLEATFEEVAETNFSDLNIFALAPVVPVVADFSDGAPITEICLSNLAPVTPKEAIFEDETGSGNENFTQTLSPTTPIVADFEDCM